MRISYQYADTECQTDNSISCSWIHAVYVAGLKVNSLAGPNQLFNI